MLRPYKKAQIHFSIINEIDHSGENSRVLLVHDRQLDAEIIIKQISKNKIDQADLFFEESKKLYKTKHTNVVQVLYACEDDESIYIAMPYYKKGSLHDLIHSRYLSLREILTYTIQFLQGLNNIHSKGLIHFDIKPDNILLSDCDEALISDFGLAKYMNNLGIAGQDSLYIKQRPPEAFSTDYFGIQYDIYQVGITMYRLCNGDDCFYNQYKKFTDSDGRLENREGFMFNVRTGKFPARDQFLPHIPPKMRKIINKCLSITPDERYKNCQSLGNDLGSIDTALDWNYEIDLENHKETWTNYKETKTVQLVKDVNGYMAQKTIIDSGNQFRIKRYSRQSLTNTELNTFFREE